MILQPPQAEEELQEEDFSFARKGMMANARTGDKDGPRLSKFTSSSTVALTPRLLGEAVHLKFYYSSYTKAIGRSCWRNK